MKNIYPVFTDASFVKPHQGDAGKYGIGVVVLDSNFQIQKILSLALRSNHDIRTDHPTTHEFYAALAGLKSVPKKSCVLVYVDNETVKRAVKGEFTPKANSRFYRDFEVVLDKIDEAKQQHLSVEAKYIHTLPNYMAFQCAAAIAHNASAKITGARKRQRTYPLLTSGPFASQSNGTKRLHRAA